MLRNVVIDRVMLFLRLIVAMICALQFFLHISTIVACCTNEWHFIRETLDLDAKMVLDLDLLC